MLNVVAELEQLERFKAEDRPVELVYLKIRTIIRDIATALQTTPDNEELKAQLQKLKAEAAALEARAPWLVADYPVELTFWPGGPGVL